MPLLQWILNLPFFLLGFGIKFLFFVRREWETIFKGIGRRVETYRGSCGKAGKGALSMEPSMELCEDSVAIIPECFRILMKS